MPLKRLGGCPKHVTRNPVLVHVMHESEAQCVAEVDTNNQWTSGLKTTSDLASIPCLAVPDAALAPFGVGPVDKFAGVCKGAIQATTDSALDIYKAALDSYKSNKAKDLQLACDLRNVLTQSYTAYVTCYKASQWKEGFTDCSGDHAALARIWCDLHCVKEAVVNGDQAILASLQEAETRAADVLVLR